MKNIIVIMFILFIGLGCGNSNLPEKEPFICGVIKDVTFGSETRDTGVIFPSINSIPTVVIEFKDGKISSFYGGKGKEFIKGRKCCIFYKGYGFSFGYITRIVYQ